MQTDPMKEWVLRDELLAEFHRWPRIVLIAVVGVLLGLAFAYFWPATYRASLELSVELNPYRVLEDQYIPEFAGAEFRNVDDYKHWQMLQLSIVVLSDPYMLETLIRLREKDPIWSAISPQELREMLSANWRNAGQWRLSASGSTAQQAADAVETWSEVVLDLTQESIASSRDLFRLELLLRSLNAELVDTQLQQTALDEIQVDINESLEELNSMQSDGVLSVEDRLGFLSTAHHMAGLFQGGESILRSFPPESAPTGEYVLWFEGVKALLENELEFVEQRIAETQEEISSVNTEWEAGLIKANGLSATLNLANRQSDSTQVGELRSYSLAALVGALLGLLAWVIMFLVHITRKGYR